MGQILQKDRIGTLTHSSGTISLTASVLTIGGQQYITAPLSRLISTDLTMAANTLYMIYAILNSGTVELRISANVNSVGPVGFTSWKLVGAFYSNGASAHGSFVNISGVPKTSDVSFTPTLSWTTNVGTPIGRWYRDGHWMKSVMKFQCTGAPSAGTLSTNMMAGFTMDQTRLNNPSAEQIQTGSATTNGVYSLFALTNGNSTTIAYASNTSDLLLAVTPTAPTVFGNGSEFDVIINVPVVGWSNTALEDL